MPLITTSPFLIGFPDIFSASTKTSSMSLCLSSVSLNRLWYHSSTWLSSQLRNKEKATRRLLPSFSN